jgi:signal transduction histidine kinase
VIQESLTNIYRHAETQDARIELIQETDSVALRVRDFGKGIPDLKFGTGIAPGVGISGMKERVKQLNGELRISRAEPGTLVHAIIPTLDQV